MSKAQLKSLNTQKELWTTLSRDMESLEEREEFLSICIDCCFHFCDCCFKI